ncbi:Telomerase protein component 1 [Tilletia horrida]|uniref:phosphatidylinositol-3,4,5-trisphosphate 3-phosphatase n=1 Tax=Tilletia horrida TaxID=155126 RepID=A0AAN6GAP6_9BASI|nr:Telomerase protein component 1 [Tilletia horrida]
MQSVKRLVSGNKARFKDPELKLELDLVYLTDQPNIILMGYPASKLEAWYRNDRADVLAFLQARHADNYRIYNFVPLAENSYDADYFDGRVSRYPFPDHHAPPLSLISLFVADIAHWLDGDPDRAAAIHCKAGKGRTGTMAISYLLSLPYIPRGPAPINNLIRMSKKNKSRLSSRASLESASSPAPSTSTPPTRAQTGVAETPRIKVQTAWTSSANGSTQHLTDSPTPASPLDSPSTPLSAHSSTAGGGGAGGGPPDPEYLFALHTRQRMKPKFSDNEWIPRALERRSMSGGGACSALSHQRSERSLASASSKQHKSPLAQEAFGAAEGEGEGREEAAAQGGKTAEAQGSRDEAKSSSPLQSSANGHEPGFTSDGFDAIVQATASAAGPPRSGGTLNRLTANANANANAPKSQLHNPEDAAQEDGDEVVAEGEKPRKYGVSISSQRRFVGYWYRILHGQDARAPLAPVEGWKGSPIWGNGLRGQRKARLVEVIVHREQSAKQTTPSKFIDDHIRVHLSRYDDGLVRRLEEEEWRVRTGPEAVFPTHHAQASAASSEEKKEAAREEAVRRARTFDWGEAATEGSFHQFATLKRASSASSSSSVAESAITTPDKDTAVRALRLTPSKPSTVLDEVDPDRELLLTVLLSKAHARLPHVASLASVWLVPCFEDVEEEDVSGVGENEATRRRRLRMRFGSDELDWRKSASGVVGIEIVWEVEGDKEEEAAS